MIKKIENAINKAQKIAIFTHLNSDADALGSSIAVKLWLEGLGKQVSIFVEEPIHDNFTFLNTASHINQNKNTTFDLAIALDCPNVKRFGQCLKYFYKIKKTINIDHHPDNENYAQINFVKSDCSSTCTIIHSMLKKLNANITKEMATCLYAGIAGDTGRFKHNNTKSEDLYACGDLIQKGADIETINYYLFSRMQFKEFNLLKLALSKVEFYCDNKFACVFLDIKSLQSVNCSIVDTYFIIDYLMNIETVKIAVVLSQEKHEECRVSIRSRDEYNAQNVARYFGGGGHIRASGCRIFKEFAKAKEDIIEVVKDEVKRCTEL